MANFDTHIVVAGVASAVVSSSILAMGIVSPMEAVVSFALGTFGGLMPDIDSNHSKAIGIGFSTISLLLTILSVFLKSATYSIVEMLIMSGVIFYTVRFAMVDIFRKISKHRGMFHSIPVALIWGLLTTNISYAFFGLSSLTSWIYGIMMSFGYIVHLVLDEVYSVDLRNRRIKKSFGTALKFFKLKTNIDKAQNLLIYLSLFLLFSISPDTSALKSELFSEKAFETFLQVLIPYDGKWFFH